MKKTLKLALALTLAFVMMFTLVACGNPCQDGHQYENGVCKNCGEKDPNYVEADPLAGTYDITMWVSEKENVKEQFLSQIDKFEAANPGIIINASIQGVSEADSASQVLADVATAPDIYCFAQDQLARLVQAAALNPLGLAAQETVRTSNDAGSVAAASVAGTLYAYPMTSDNGYYMYYDTSIISEEEAEDMTKLIAACNEANLKFRFSLENAWYTASFFFATGCHSNWTMDSEGNFNAIDDTFNSAEGLIAMKGMQELAQSKCYDSNADIFTDAGVIITGIWNADAAADHFGDNLGVTDLPSFTVDGKSYHLGSYGGNKLMGVKPQTDVKRSAVLSRLAQFLTNAECQLERFNSFQWGPSNLEAQANEAVKANASLAALAKQSAYSIPQGQIQGSWWDIAKLLGAEARTAKSDAELQKALDDYDSAIDAILSMDEDAKQAWSVIGSLCGTNWDTDLPMTKKSDGVYESEVLDLKAGDEFKCRQGASWDLNIGSDGNHNGPNFVVETAGKYIIRLEWTEGSTTGVVTMVPAE